MFLLALLYMLGIICVGRVVEYSAVYDRRGTVRRQSNRRLRQETTDYIQQSKFSAIITMCSNTNVLNCF